MVVRKVTVSLEEGAYQAAVDAATQSGLSLSAWLSRAADDRARVERGLRAVRDYEAEYGELPTSGAVTADEALDAAGVGVPATLGRVDSQLDSPPAALRALRSPSAA